MACNSFFTILITFKMPLTESTSLVYFFTGFASVLMVYSLIRHVQVSGRRRHREPLTADPQDLEDAIKLSSLALLTQSENAQLHNSATKIVLDRAMAPRNLPSLINYCRDHQPVEVRMKAVTALRLLTKIESNRKSLVNAGALEILVDFLASTEMTELSQKYAAAQICDLIQGDSENKRKVLQLNILPSLKTILTSPTIQNKELKYWALMAVHQISLDEESTKSLIEHGFIPLLAQMARLTFGNQHMPKFCMQSLVRVIATVDQSEAKSLLCSLLDYDIVNLVSVCLRSDDVELIYWATGLMHEFVLKDIALPSFRAIKGVQTILLTLLIADEVNISRVVLRTVKFMAVHEDAFQIEMIRTGLLRRIVRCVASEDEDTQYWAILCLHDVATQCSRSYDAFHDILEADELKNLLEFSTTSKMDAVAHVADIIGRICSSGRNYPQLAATPELLPTLCKFLEWEESDVQCSAANALFSLAAMSADMSHRVSTLCIDQLINILLHSDRDRVQLICAKILLMLGIKDKDLAPRLTKEVVKNLIHRLLELGNGVLCSSIPFLSHIPEPNFWEEQSASLKQDMKNEKQTQATFDEQDTIDVNEDEDKVEHFISPLGSPSTFNSPTSVYIQLPQDQQEEQNEPVISPLRKEFPDLPLNFLVNFSENLIGIIDALRIFLDNIPFLHEIILLYFNHDSNDLVDDLVTMLVQLAALPALEGWCRAFGVKIIDGPDDEKRAQMAEVLEKVKAWNKVGSVEEIVDSGLVESTSVPEEQITLRKNVVSVGEHAIACLGALLRAEPVRTSLINQDFVKLALRLFQSSRSVSENVLICLGILVSYRPSLSVETVGILSRIVWKHLLHAILPPPATKFYLSLLLEYAIGWPYEVSEPHHHMWTANEGYVELNRDDRTKLAVIGLDGREIRNDSWTFESVRATHGVPPARFKVAYEIVLRSEGLIQVGWASKMCRFDPERGTGVGDDNYSFAYDGYRRKKWHGRWSEENPYGETWSIEDVVTCALDLTNGTVSFWLNQRSMGVAFSNVDKVGDVIWYPALSIATNQGCRVRFGGPLDPLSFCPKGYEAFADRAVEYQSLSPLEDPHPDFIMSSRDVELSMEDIIWKASKPSNSRRRAPVPIELFPLDSTDDERPPDLVGILAPPAEIDDIAEFVDETDPKLVVYFEVACGRLDETRYPQTQIGLLHPHGHIIAFCYSIESSAGFIISYAFDPTHPASLHEYADFGPNDETVLKQTGFTIITEGDVIGFGYEINKNEEEDRGGDGKIVITLNGKIIASCRVSITTNLAPFIPHLRGLEKCSVNFGQERFLLGSSNELEASDRVVSFLKNGN